MLARDLEERQRELDKFQSTSGVQLRGVAFLEAFKIRVNLVQNTCYGVKSGFFYRRSDGGGFLCIRNLATTGQRRARSRFDRHQHFLALENCKYFQVTFFAQFCHASIVTPVEKIHVS